MLSRAIVMTLLSFPMCGTVAIAQDASSALDAARRRAAEVQWRNQIRLERVYREAQAMQWQNQQRLDQIHRNALEMQWRNQVSWDRMNRQTLDTQWRNQAMLDRINRQAFEQRNQTRESASRLQSSLDKGLNDAFADTRRNLGFAVAIDLVYEGSARRLISDSFAHGLVRTATIAPIMMDTFNAGRQLLEYREMQRGLRSPFDAPYHLGPALRILNPTPFQDPMRSRTSTRTITTYEYSVRGGYLVR